MRGRVRPQNQKQRTVHLEVLASRNPEERACLQGAPRAGDARPTEARRSSGPSLRTSTSPLGLGAWGALLWKSPATVACSHRFNTRGCSPRPLWRGALGGPSGQSGAARGEFPRGRPQGARGDPRRDPESRSRDPPSRSRAPFDPFEQEREAGFRIQTRVFLSSVPGGIREPSRAGGVEWSPGGAASGCGCARSARRTFCGSRWRRAREAVGPSAR